MHGRPFFRSETTSWPRYAKQATVLVSVSAGGKIVEKQRGCALDAWSKWLCLVRQNRVSKYLGTVSGHTAGGNVVQSPRQHGHVVAGVKRERSIALIPNTRSQRCYGACKEYYY